MDGRTHPDKPFARYADDRVIHCRTLEEAELLLENLKTRMEECKLELHPEKTRIVYCKDDKRKDSIQIQALTFWIPSESAAAKSRNGQIFYSFLPVSEQAKKAMRQKIRSHFYFAETYCKT